MTWFIQQRAERRLPKLIDFASIFRPKQTKPRKRSRLWRWNGIEVVAYAKTDARGKLKRIAGLKRLPVGAVVECLGFAK